MVLMIKDITHSYLTASIHLDLVGSQHHLKHKDLVFLEAWTTQVLSSMGNKGYSIIKGIESVCKGRIIQLTETILDPDEVWLEMMSKIETKEQEILRSTSLSDQLASHLQSITDVDRVSEFFCLMKMAGHPQVDVKGGGRKSKDKGTNHPTNRKEDCLGIERSFCHVYTRGFVAKHSEWPPLQFLRDPDEPRLELEKLRDANFQNLPLGLSMYPPSDWDHCVFLPHKSFDVDSDLLSLISDKSLSYLRSEYTCAWANMLPFAVPKPSTNRRVLLDLLKAEDFSLADVVRTVQTRCVPEEWKIVTITPKEREMKEDPRMFAMMVFQMRTFFVALEHNTAKHIFPEISEQTMTLSKLEIVRRFFGLSNPGEVTTKVHLEIDFEAWNLAWEESTVAPVGCRQDQIFGEPGTYTYIHEFFKSSLINVRVDGLVPEGLNQDNWRNPPESDLIWYNHIGGFEGINQKLWTGDTIGMIHWALWEMGIDYQISGQADNQVLTITVRFPDDLPPGDHNQFTRDLVRTIKARLARMCKRVGQVIKSEECIQSTSYLSYSKDMWVNGRCLSTSMKSITRLFPTTSDDTPSLYEMVSGLTSGGLSVAEKSLEPGSAYWTTLALTSLLLHNELTNSMLHSSKLSNELDYLNLSSSAQARVCQTLSIVPLGLGGLPAASWIEFMHRGVPDPLTSGLTWMGLMRTIPTINGWYNNLMDPTSSMFNLSPNLDMLILDPYSLPLTRPSNPKLKAANAVRDHLLDITHNRPIRAMLEAGSEGNRVAILNWLSSLTPFYPKIAHDLYNLSPPGVVEKFSKRFTSTRTILAVGSRCGVDVQNLAISSDLRTIVWTLSELKNSILNSSRYPPTWTWEPNTSYRHATRLRARWGVLSLEGITTACAFDLGCFSDSPILSLKTPSLVVAAVQPDCIDPIHTRGPSSPYLGSSTQPKTAYKGAKPVDSSPPVTDAIRILGIRNWITRPGSRSWDDLTTLAQVRVSFDVTLLEQFVDPVIGGTLMHRYTMSDAESGAYLSCHPNISSNIVLSSNAAGEIGEKDYPVMIQTIYLTLISIVCMTWTRHFSDHSLGTKLCYLIPSTVDLPLLYDSPLSDVSIPIPHLINLSDTPYLVGSRVMIPGRSMRSTRNTSERPESFLQCAEVVSTADCLRHHLRQWIRRMPTPIQYGGRSWAEELPLKVVDIPEVYRLESTTFLECLTDATMDSIRLGREYRETKAEWILRYTATFEDRLLKVAPALLSTYNATLKSSSLELYGRLTGIEGSIRLTSLCSSLWRNRAHLYHTIVFVKEPESLSTSVIVVINRLVTRLNLADTPSALKSAKSLADITRKVRILGVDEWDIQRRLWIVVERLAFMTSCLSYSDLLTGKVLRSLRDQVVPEKCSHDIFLQLGIEERDLAGMVLKSCKECKVGGSKAVWSRDEILLPYEEIIDGWICRPLSYLGAGFYNWAPIRTIIPNNSTIHIIGAGDATIHPVLPPNSLKVYYDTRKSTLRRGQSMVDPPERGKDSSSVLSPLSWSTDLDIRSLHSLDLIVSNIQDQSVVVIDVDHVSLFDRLRARDYMSNRLRNLLVAVRVTANPEEINILLRSVCSSADRSTVWWRSPVHPSHEVIVGNSSGACIAPNSPIGNQSQCSSIATTILSFKSPETWNSESRYVQLSASLAYQRARLARRGFNREEERIQILSRLLLES